jgi:peptide/nickel transport system permease protein
MSELQGIYLNTNKPLRNKFGVREKTLLSIALFVFLLGSIMIMGSLISADDISINLTNKNLEPSLNHLFGTDWVGRDMFYRTIKGLSLSMKVGFLASFISGTIALTLGVIGATLGKTVDNIITWIIDLILSVPHALIVILISISVGGGFKGIVLGVSLTHWPSLTRVIRAEIMQIRESDYVKISKKFGKPNPKNVIEAS